MKELIKNGIKLLIYADGRIFVKDRIVLNNGTPVFRRGRFLTPVPNGKYGYRQIGVNNGICKRYYVHRLVWEAFNGEIPVGFEIDHLDDNANNNALSNLQLSTRKQNMDKLMPHLRRASDGRIIGRQVQVL